MDLVICSRVTERTFKLKPLSSFQLPSDKKETIWCIDRLINSYFQHTVLIYCVLDCFCKFDANFGIP